MSVEVEVIGQARDTVRIRWTDMSTNLTGKEMPIAINMTEVEAVELLFKLQEALRIE